MIAISEKIIRLQHTMYNVEAMKEVASTELVCVHIDTKTRKSCTFPTRIKDKCAELFEMTT